MFYSSYLIFLCELKIKIDYSWNPCENKNIYAYTNIRPSEEDILKYIFR